MSLVERAFQLEAIQRRARLMNPPNAVDDSPIDLKPKRERTVLTLKLGPITAYQNKRTRPAPEDVTRIVCEHYNVSPDDLQGAVRTQILVRPRQVWAYLAKELMSISFPKIGHYLGGRDHTTAKHACDKIAALVESDKNTAEEIEHLKFKIGRLFSIRNSVVCFDLREV